MIKKAMFALCAVIMAVCGYAEGWIRVNQLGYLPKSKKVAVLISQEPVEISEFDIIDAINGNVVTTVTAVREAPVYGTMQSAYRLDFSDFDLEGAYMLRGGGITSPIFPINTRVYDGTSDFLLNYMRQQRCGYNPYVKDSCHVHDGYIEYHPTKTGQHIDVTGGWHDAGDYLQYTTTSANAIYQMLLAYSSYPESFGDQYNAYGHPGPNGIPDIVDEIKWGLDWLCKMNPEPGEYYNQIADDRDHATMDVPNKDMIDYGYGPGLGRPVYFCSGEPQQRGQFKNATRGVASTAGKFSSCFSLGSQVLKDFYPEFAADLAERAAPAFQAGVDKPGVCQTASVVSPYIYEEDNWVDDMELAAIELYRNTGKRDYLTRAVEYARQEPITPWMGADSARHYQWYPFMNVGHYRIASLPDKRLSEEFMRNMRTGIDRTWEKAQKSPFLHGIPYIWCSNNLTVAMLTQCRLYRQLSGDERYLEMETALLDWLFGTNPWGTSMICDLPLSGDNPEQPHSAFVNVMMGTTPGGLVDGPVYTTIFESLRGVNLDGVDWRPRPAQAFEGMQPDEMVYHDAMHDYSTNEPTMDGTASLTYYLAAMQDDGARQRGESANDQAANRWHKGGIIQTDPNKKQISLVFSAAEYADGAPKIMSLLDKYDIKGAFFFTGEFFENRPETVRQLHDKGHYVGSHSYGHLLYMPWENPDTLLLTYDDFVDDMRRSFKVMADCGITAEEADMFLPPYEYYNEYIADWAKNLGLQLVDFTPGTGTNADYTTPDMDDYRTSQQIYDHLMDVEKRKGLNGAILLVHFGTDPLRTDKFYDKHLERAIKELRRRGYTFVPLRDAISTGK